MNFIRNIWYVAAWNDKIASNIPIICTIIDEPVALYRKGDGTITAMEDRCPHRHAPLSLERIEGDDLRRQIARQLSAEAPDAQHTVMEMQSA